MKFWKTKIRSKGVENETELTEEKPVIVTDVQVSQETQHQQVTIKSGILESNNDTNGQLKIQISSQQDIPITSYRPYSSQRHLKAFRTMLSPSSRDETIPLKPSVTPNNKQTSNQIHPFLETTDPLQGASTIAPNKSPQSKLPPSGSASELKEFSFWSVVQIRKMLQRLKKQYAYANLTKLHYEFIGDKAAVSSNNERYDYRDRTDTWKLQRTIQQLWHKVALSGPVKKSMLCFNYILSKIPVFSPQATLKQIWDLLLCLSLLLLFFCVPLHIAVSLPMHSIVKYSALWVALGITTLDCLVSFNTGYFTKGHIVIDRYHILEKYLKDQFLSDVISLTPVYIVLIRHTETFSFSLSIFSLFFLIKVKDLVSIIQKIEKSFLLTPRQTNLVELLKLLSVILFIAHLCACIWVFEAQQQDQLSLSWFGNDKLEQNNWSPLWLDQYIKAYYFSTVTMVTVGYGDIYPVNNSERVLSVGTMLLACCIFAYIVNSMGNIFQDFFRHSKEVKDNFYAINNYMEKKNVSSSLKMQIKEYLSYYWDEERDNLTEKEQKIIRQLSVSLRNQLKLEANKIVLADTPIFHDNFSKILNEKICSLISEQRYHPEQYITKLNEEDDCSIFFIQKGRVEVFSSHVQQDGSIVNKTFMSLGKGQYFGAHSFFTGLPRNMSVRSIEFCQLLVIKRQDFINALSTFDEDYQTFCMIKDQLIFAVSSNRLEMKCFSCKSQEHMFSECPMIHYAPSKIQIIKKYNFSSTHHRRYTAKRYSSKFHTLAQLEITIKEGLQFIEENESFLLDQDWIHDSESESDLSENEDDYHVIGSATVKKNQNNYNQPDHRLLAEIKAGYVYKKQNEDNNNFNLRKNNLNNSFERIEELSIPSPPQFCLGQSKKHIEEIHQSFSKLDVCSSPKKQIPEGVLDEDNGQKMKQSVSPTKNHNNSSNDPERDNRSSLNNMDLGSKQNRRRSYFGLKLHTNSSELSKAQLQQLQLLSQDKIQDSNRNIDVKDSDWRKNLNDLNYCGVTMSMGVGDIKDSIVSHSNNKDNNDTINKNNHNNASDISLELITNDHESDIQINNNQNRDGQTQDKHHSKEINLNAFEGFEELEKHPKRSSRKITLGLFKPSKKNQKENVKQIGKKKLGSTDFLLDRRSNQANSKGIDDNNNMLVFHDFSDGEEEQSSSDNNTKNVNNNSSSNISGNNKGAKSSSQYLNLALQTNENNHNTTGNFCRSHSSQRRKQRISEDTLKNPVKIVISSDYKKQVVARENEDKNGKLQIKLRRNKSPFQTAVREKMSKSLEKNSDIHRLRRRDSIDEGDQNGCNSKKMKRSSSLNDDKQKEELVGQEQDEEFQQFQLNDPEKELKKQKFWKHIFKRGKQLGGSEQNSPFIKKAEEMLAKKNNEVSSNNKRLMQAQQNFFPSIQSNGNPSSYQPSPLLPPNKTNQSINSHNNPNNNPVGKFIHNHFPASRSLSFQSLSRQGSDIDITNNNANHNVNNLFHRGKSIHAQQQRLNNNNNSNYLSVNVNGNYHQPVNNNNSISNNTAQHSGNNNIYHISNESFMSRQKNPNQGSISPLSSSSRMLFDGLDLKNAVHMILRKVQQIQTLQHHYVHHNFPQQILDEQRNDPQYLQISQLPQQQLHSPLYVPKQNSLMRKSCQDPQGLQNLIDKATLGGGGGTTPLILPTNVAQQQKKSSIKWKESYFPYQDADELILDILKNFSTYYPEHNLSVIAKPLNAKALLKMKLLKKTRVKKSKGNMLLGESFKNNLMTSKLMRNALHKMTNPQFTPSEDESEISVTGAGGKNSTPFHKRASRQQILIKHLKSNTDNGTSVNEQGGNGSGDSPSSVRGFGVLYDENNKNNNNNNSPRAMQTMGQSHTKIPSIFKQQ